MADSNDRQEVTAYILGELEHEEKTVLEIEIGGNEGLRAECEELRTISALISRELESDEKFELTLRQREAILGSLRAAQPPPAEVTSVQPEHADIWERLEFLAVFVFLLGIGFALPQIPGAVKAIRLLWYQRFPEEGGDELSFSEFDESGLWSALPDKHAPGYFKMSVIAAVIAILFYAWIRVKLYPRRPMPAWCVFGVVALYAGGLMALMWLKNH